MKLWDADIDMTAAASKLHSAALLVDPSGGAPLDVTIFVSCYNESSYISGTLDTICEAMDAVGLSFEVIVIDDGSRDNSRELVRAYITAHPERGIILRANKHNKGLAQNYVDGAFLGAGKYYRLICGDNAEPKETIVSVFKSVGQADIIVPYYTSSEGKSMKRQLISRTFTGIINLITGYRLHYYNGLAVHLRHNVMRWHSHSRGFGFQADILCRLLDLGYTYKEVPVITVEQREGDKSNALTLKNLLSVGHTIMEIAIRRVSNRVYRRK